ncbi:MAG: hypothetical protein H6841_07935 [Planctomycetes bacterium]|nr:hypothetical protein [Planctomycetota bacterium]MCB9935475.1 hypothetical protein [Planctomycetota bacterium]
MKKLTAALLAALVLGGCVTSQGRDNPARDTYTGVEIETETRRHGPEGQEIAELFYTGEILEARQDYSGRSNGLELNEFYTIEIAEDPLRPTVLTSVGYIRRLREDRGDLFIYEFYDVRWQRFAYMNPEGSVYRYEGATEEYMGRFELDAAVRRLYYAPSGYGYDAELQDHALVNLKDNDVVTAEPRARGVHHRTHRSAPPVVVYTPKRSGETRLLADRYSKERFDEREAETAKRLHEERTGGFGEDEEYGGLRYKNGNPVDENDRPLRPGSVK